MARWGPIHREGRGLQGENRLNDGWSMDSRVDLEKKGTTCTWSIYKHKIIQAEGPRSKGAVEIEPYLQKTLVGSRDTFLNRQGGGRIGAKASKA